MRPRGKSLGLTELVKLRHQLAPEDLRGIMGQARELWPFHSGSPFGRLQGPSASW